MQIHKQFVSKKLLVGFFVWFMLFSMLPMTLHAQTVSNVTVEQVDKTIYVSYDLDKQAEISLHLSIDGGKTYTELHKLSGDVGKNVAEGHKTIVWDVLAERESLVGDDVLFWVKAEQNNIIEFTVKGVTFKMIYVEGGSFTMGCTSKFEGDCYSDEKPAHQVLLSDFYMGETEVTQALWCAAMGGNHSFCHKGDNFPVEGVSWNECQSFCTALNDALSKELPDGYRFALPTEAQWEYSAKGGNYNRGYRYSGDNHIDSVAWYSSNSKSRTHLVKTKKANELGLYDMSGNVWEWCRDLYGNYSYSVQKNPTGPRSGTYVCVRGGYWGTSAGGCRLSTRWHASPNEHNPIIGFRLALVRE